ncbi:MAG: hypothetical protein ACYTGB_15425 [Planctomycetota bacterium]|jgi:hypothetical protein
MPDPQREHPDNYPYWRFLKSLFSSPGMPRRPQPQQAAPLPTMEPTPVFESDEAYQQHLAALRAQQQPPPAPAAPPSTIQPLPGQSVQNFMLFGDHPSPEQLASYDRQSVAAQEEAHARFMGGGAPAAAAAPPQFTPPLPSRTPERALPPLPAGLDEASTDSQIEAELEKRFRKGRLVRGRWRKFSPEEAEELYTRYSSLGRGVALGEDGMLMVLPRSEQFENRADYLRSQGIQVPTAINPDTGKTWLAGDPTRADRMYRQRVGRDMRTGTLSGRQTPDVINAGETVKDLAAARSGRFMGDVTAQLAQAFQRRMGRSPNRDELMQLVARYYGIGGTRRRRR